MQIFDKIMKSPHTSLEEKHLPVMIDEVLKICNPKNGGNFYGLHFWRQVVIQKNYLNFKETKVVALDRDVHT